MSIIALSRPQAGVPVDKPLADAVTLDLADIQSLVLYPVAFPFGRFCYFRFPEMQAARAFVSTLVPLVTNATHSGRPHADRKASEVTVAFTHDGLAAAGIPGRSLASFSAEFQQGMKARAGTFLIDRADSHPDAWEPLWNKGNIHLLVIVQTTDVPDPSNAQRLQLSGRETLASLCDSILTHARTLGVEVAGVQDAGALIDPATNTFTDKEHFGYADGIGNPDIAGDGWPAPAGSGKSDGKGGWTALAAGEFILGTPDEAGEMPVAPVPIGLARNGTYLCLRKLHENVGQFRRWLHEEGERYPGGPELLAAKVVGRFRDGTPLARSPLEPTGYDLQQRMDPHVIPQLTDFVYRDDVEGARCPMGAHIRRVNPRDSLGFNGVLVDRRRIIRRGSPYGEWVPESTPLDEVDRLDAVDAEHESRHGIMFMSINASIERQFEFVQREWMNYGNDFRQGNDRDPLLGNRDGQDRMIIQSDPSNPDAPPPHFCKGLPQFVTTRGGEYFFIPGIEALRAIARGTVATA